ncbi:MAG: hypothetical protein ACI9EF_001815 [Pseudohongiellaceae bacterium]|jgi:hypothetical protein
MDVYFEKIAGVAEPKELQQEREAAMPERAPAPTATAPSAQQALDPNGFPLTPMSDQDELWFIQAARMHRPLARGAGLAKASGNLLIFSALFSVLIGAFGLATGDTAGGGSTLAIGLLLFLLGMSERSGGTELAALNPSAPKRLALNQVALLLLVGAGCFLGTQDTGAAGAASIDTTGLPPEMASKMTAEIESLAPLLIYGVYGIMFGISLLCQGSMALYYITRRKTIEAFHEDLPPWVTDVVSTLQRH